MKVGDLVRLSAFGEGGVRVGVAIELLQKKCWRTDLLGHKVDWSLVEPELHAVVLYSCNTTLTFPVVDLEVINDSG